MYFAKFEMNGKNDSLKKVAGTLTTLAEVVDADRKAGAWVHPPRASLDTPPVPWQEARCQVLASVALALHARSRHNGEGC